MSFAFPFIRVPAVTPEVPAIVRAAGPGNVQWNRPVFKAPPLQVSPPVGEVRRQMAQIQNRALFR
jgi:hypothetical protein